MPLRRRMPQRGLARRRETGVAERYSEMGMVAALSRPWDYPTACGELAGLLRHGYANLPKAVQALVAGDVLLAFRLLPEAQTGYAVTAANGLLQAVEAALPKQKKAQAVSEFKRSVVTHKRRAKVQPESGPPHIPYDVLVHIFSFLDMRSLVAAGLVCWSWNSSANDNKLWETTYSMFFRICHVSGNRIPVSSGMQSSNGLLVQHSTDSAVDDPIMNWKEVFHNKYAEYSAWSPTSNRAVCQHCRSILWLSNLMCAAPHRCPKNGKDEIKLLPLLPDAVTRYILHTDDLASTASDTDDTDSDSEGYEPRRFSVSS